MQRYFTNEKNENGYVLNKDDEYHIKKVMRMKINDCIEIVDNKKVYLCKIKSLEPLKVDMEEEINENNEFDKKIIVVQSLVNENKMDLILQKGTELGAYSFYGYKSVNSVIKENNKSDKKVDRWQKIVKESSEQSKRNIIPKVEKIIDLKELCELKADLKIILSVKEKSNSIKNVLQSNRCCDTMIIVIGPEGGFDLKEEDTLVNSGFERVTLGKRVLRTETASLVALSMINYEWMV